MMVNRQLHFPPQPVGFDTTMLVRILPYITLFSVVIASPTSLQQFFLDISLTWLSLVSITLLYLVLRVDHSAWLDHQAQCQLIIGEATEAVRECRFPVRPGSIIVTPARFIQNGKPINGHRLTFSFIVGDGTVTQSVYWPSYRVVCLTETDEYVQFPESFYDKRGSLHWGNPLLFLKQESLETLKARLTRAATPPADR